MNTTGGTLSFEATLQYIDLKKGIADIESRVKRMTSTVANEGKKVDDTFSRLGRLAVGAFAFNGLASLPQQIIKVRSEFQGLEIAFTTMLRSGTKAQALLKDITQFAGTTPFGLKDAAAGAKQLLAYGSNASTVVSELRTLGDIAAGTGTQLSDLIYLYGTLRTQGRAYAVDIRQFAGRGIPIYEELGKVLKVNTSEVNAFVEAGKVGFKEVEQALKNLTTGSGIFAGLTEAQSKSLAGLRERLGDAYDRMLNDIGKKNQDLIAGVITGASEAVENYQTVVDILGVTVSAYGGYKAALLLASVAQTGNIAITRAQAIAQAAAATSMSSLSLSQTRLAASTSLVARAQAALNASVLANPYVLIGTAIAALVSYMVLFRKETQEIKSEQELLAESTQNANTNFAAQAAEVNKLVSVLKNQNVAESERFKAYNKLNELSPTILNNLSFEKAKTADLTKTVNEYVESLKKKIRLEAGQDTLKTAYQQEFEATEKTQKAREALLKLEDEAAKRNNKPRTINADGSSTQSTADALKIKQAKQNLEGLEQIENKAKEVSASVAKSLGVIYKGDSTEAIKASIANDELLMASVDKLSVTYKNAEERIKKSREELAKRGDKPPGKDFTQMLEEASTAVALRATKAFADTDNKIEALAKKVKLRLGEAVRGTSERAQLQQLEKELDRLQGKKTAAEKRAEADAAKIGPLGSVSYYENIAKKAQEALEKINGADPNASSKIQYQLMLKLNAEQKAEQARKLITIKSFDEELADKRDKYTLYQKWVETYSKQSADEQFSDLLKSGQSYLDYLNDQIAALEAKKSKGKLSDKDAKNLDTLGTERNDITGKKSKIDLFQEGLEKARTSASSLAEYLVILKQKQDELNAAPKTKNDFDIRKQLADEVVKTQTELQNRLQQFLTSYASSGEQQLAIQKEFAEKRAALDLRYNDKRGDDYKQALGVINTAEKQALQDFQQRKFEETEEYKNTTKVLLEEGRKREKIEIDLQTKAVERAKKEFGVNSEVYKQQKQKLDQLTKNTGTDFSALVGQYSGVIGEFGQALSQLGGTVGAVGGLITGLASNLGILSQAFDKNITSAQKTQLIIGAAVNIISSITSAAAQRKQKESEYYNEMIAQQSKYNQLLNEQIGIRSQQEESVFVKNYTGRIQDGIAQLNDASKGYQESLKKLNEGQAKIGQRDGVDFGKVASNAVSGAAIGTALLPGIGTVVGGLIGGIVGLFAAKSKQDVFGSLLGEYPELVSASGEFNKALAETLISTNRVDETTKLLLEDTIAWTDQIAKAKEQIKGVVADLAGSLGGDLRNSLVGAFEDGTDAAKAFAGSVGKIMEDVVSNILFSQIFDEQFKKLQEDLATSLATGGTGADAFQKFYSQASGLSQQFNDSLAEAQKAAAQAGLNIFQPSSANKNNNSMPGAIKSLTEDTGGVIAGQMTAMHITQANVEQHVKQSLFYLARIDTNTGGTWKAVNDLTDEVGIVRRGLQAKGFL